MSEEQVSAPTDEGGSEFEPITSQEALDKLIGQRIDRVKKQFAGYDDLKAKASKYDELEQASKSELEKERERAAALEKELTTERFNALRASVAAAKGVPAAALSGSSREELEACADGLLEWRGVQEEKKPPPKQVKGLKSGATSTDSTMDPKERAAQAVRALRGIE